MRKKIFPALLIAPLCFVACKNNISVDKQATSTNNFPTVQTVLKESMSDTAAYKVFQSITPHMLPGNKQIIIQILQDSQLTGTDAVTHYYPALHAAQLLFHSDEDILNPDNPGFKPSLLVLKDVKGNIISSKKLDVPCARIDSVYIDEENKGIIYLLTLDYSVGMGSYNGPATYFVQFADTGIINYNSGDKAFATTLKSKWAIRYVNGLLQVCSMRCRPADGDDFAITTTISNWHTDSFSNSSAVKTGFWEDESDTSAESLMQFFNNFTH